MYNLRRLLFVLGELYGAFETAQIISGKSGATGMADASWKLMTTEPQPLFYLLVTYHMTNSAGKIDG